MVNPLKFIEKGIKMVKWKGFLRNQIKLSNIISAVDEEVKMLKCNKNSKKGCNGKSVKCITHSLWDELGEHINLFFKQKSLEDVLNIEKKFQRTEN